MSFQNSFQKIYHIDSGRKFFSKDQILELIDQLKEHHYDSFEISISNNGLRMLLADMSVVIRDPASGEEFCYGSADMIRELKKGNDSYYADPNGNALTEAEMDEIIAYADSCGIGIIPLLNTPGHMNAIRYAAVALCDPDAGYEYCETSIDLTNEKALAFTLAIVQKYIDYFAGKGCRYFNLGADEYGEINFGRLQDDGNYALYINYVNKVADMIKKAGMEPMMFNDGIYYRGENFSENASLHIDTDIIVCYWTSGTDTYTPASLNYLIDRGFKRFIYTFDKWYYCVEYDGEGWCGFDRANHYTKSEPLNALTGDDRTIGCMSCLWCDLPEKDYEKDKPRIFRLIANLDRGTK